MISLQWTTGIIGVVIAMTIISLVRKDRLYTRYCIWWLSVAASIVLLGVFPGVIDALARQLGIAYAPSLVFILAIMLLLLKNLTMDIERSKMEVKLRRLTQRMAILEDELQQVRKESDRIQS